MIALPWILLLLMTAVTWRSLRASSDGRAASRPPGVVRLDGTAGEGGGGGSEESPIRGGSGGRDRGGRSGTFDDARGGEGVVRGEGGGANGSVSSVSSRDRPRAGTPPSSVDSGSGAAGGLDGGGEGPAGGGGGPPAVVVGPVPPLTGVRPYSGAGPCARRFGSGSDAGSGVACEAYYPYVDLGDYIPGNDDNLLSDSERLAVVRVAPSRAVGPQSYPNATVLGGGGGGVGGAKVVTLPDGVDDRLAVLTRRGTRSALAQKGVRTNQDRAVIVSPFLIEASSSSSSSPPSNRARGLGGVGEGDVDFVFTAEDGGENSGGGAGGTEEGGVDFQFAPSAGAAASSNAPDDPYNYNGAEPGGGADANVDGPDASDSTEKAGAENGTSPSSGPVGSERNLLMGIFDGHGAGGEAVAERAALRLPALLAARLGPLGSNPSRSRVELALNETFSSMDRSFHQINYAGSSASVVLRLGDALYFANAGDSRSMLCAFSFSSGSVKVLYKTRPDKPDLPDERARIEKAGGLVYAPPPSQAGGPGVTSRVVARVGNRTIPGLALSRAFGDVFWKKRGVVSDPVVKAVDLNKTIRWLRRKEAERAAAAARGAPPAAGAAAEAATYHLFVVQSTDGVLDVIEPVQVAAQAARCLYEPRLFQRPLMGLESLLRKAGKLWEGRPKPPQIGLRYYRDDLTVSIAKLPL